jgi:hypothetical protein
LAEYRDHLSGAAMNSALSRSRGFGVAVYDFVAAGGQPVPETARQLVDPPSLEGRFPLCAPAREAPALEDAAADRCAERMAMMPVRITIRAQNGAQRVAAERHDPYARLVTQAAQTGPA